MRVPNYQQLKQAIVKDMMASGVECDCLLDDGIELYRATKELTAVTVGQHSKPVFTVCYTVIDSVGTCELFADVTSVPTAWSFRLRDDDPVWQGPQSQYELCKAQTEALWQS